MDKKAIIEFVKAEGYAKDYLFMALDSLQASNYLPSQEPTAAFIRRLKLEGQRVPIQVTEEPDGGWYILDGIRRIKALRLLKQETIEAIWVHGVGHLERTSWATSINAARSDNPIRNAEMIKGLMNEQRSRNEISVILGLTSSEVDRCLALSDLDLALKNAVEDGRMSISAALSATKLRKSQRLELVQKADAGKKITGKDVAQARQVRSANGMAALAAQMPTAEMPEREDLYVVAPLMPGSDYSQPVTGIEAARRIAGEEKSQIYKLVRVP